MKSFKSGTYINQGYYRSFQPNLINKAWEISDMEVVALLSKADRMLGRLDMYSEHIPNIELFISMHVMKEATQSSKIEGTQTNMEEAILSKEDVPLDKRDDWTEVHNYINAMNEAIKLLDGYINIGIINNLAIFVPLTQSMFFGTSYSGSHG